MKPRRPEPGGPDLPAVSALGVWSPGLVLDALWLAGLVIVFFPLSVHLMRKRLVQ
jgi:hypothetical protein